MMLGISKSNITSSMWHNWDELRIHKCIWNKQLHVTENKISYVIKMNAIKFEASGTAAKQTDISNQQTMFF